MRLRALIQPKDGIPLKKHACVNDTESYILIFLGVGADSGSQALECFMGTLQETERSVR
jgi:hypothetical protein